MSGQTNINERLTCDTKSSHSYLTYEFLLEISFSSFFVCVISLHLPVKFSQRCGVCGVMTSKKFTSLISRQLHISYGGSGAGGGAGVVKEWWCRKNPFRYEFLV